MKHSTGHAERTDRQTGRLENPLPGLLENAWQAQELRRRQMRFGTRYLQVQSPVFGWAVEVSASGLRLESPAQLVTGGRYVFRLNYGAHFLHLPGRVVWSRLDRIEITDQGRLAIHQAGIELHPAEARPGWLAALADRASLAVGV